MSTQPTTPCEAALPPDKKDLVRAELEAILRSHWFSRSERHSKFLRFVCEETLDGEASHLSEYSIAHRVFGRGPDYSPGEDSVVRRQAFSVRQKLQEFYAAEGKDDAIRIVLPVGRYVATFQFADQSETPKAATAIHHRAVDISHEPIPVAPARRDVRWVVACVCAVALLCGMAGWYAGVRSERKTILDPVLTRFWGPWLTESDGVVICFSNAMTAGIRRTEEPFPESSLTKGIMLHPDQADRIRDQFHLPAGGYFYINPALAHAKMGEALGSIPLTSMFTKAGVPVRASQSRYLNWHDFRHQSLVLLGHDEANQWLDPILSKLPFKLARTRADKPRRIVISKPRVGERSEYFPDYSKGQNPPAEDYALISLLKGIDGRHNLALLNGVNTEGTNMALDFLTEPAALRGLEAALRKANPVHNGPWYFQAILHSELRDGVPTGIEIVSLRELQ